MEGALYCLWWILRSCSGAQSGARFPRFFATTTTQAFTVLYLALSERSLEFFRRPTTLQCRGFRHCSHHVCRFRNTNNLPQSSELVTPLLVEAPY